MADEVGLKGLDNVLNILKTLPKEVVSKRGGPVRASLRKGAVVLHKQSIANLQVALNNKKDPDEKDSTGLLLKNVVVTRGKPPTDGNGERYLVRVRRKMYAGRKGERVTTLKTAQLLEYGSSQQPAEPWLRPAFATKVREAITTVEQSLIKSVNSIVKRLSKQKGT